MCVVGGTCGYKPVYRSVYMSVYISMIIYKGMFLLVRATECKASFTSVTMRVLVCFEAPPYMMSVYLSIYLQCIF